MVVQARRRHKAALAWYQKALAIFEQLRDQDGIGRCYGQLGVLAAERGEPKEALGLFKKALVIFKSLGDRVSIARTYSQIGKLYTILGDALNGLRFQVQSFPLHLEMASPDICFDLYCFARQRELLGQDRFHARLIEHLGEEGAATVEHWLRQQPPQPTAGG